VTDRRAMLIARDQISKHNGALTRARMQGAGIARYQWSSSKDERVRTSHSTLEGRVFSWDRPPPVGHPGEDIQCRCVALPVFDDEAVDLPRMAVQGSGPKPSLPYLSQPGSSPTVHPIVKIEPGAERTLAADQLARDLARGPQELLDALQQKGMSIDVLARPLYLHPILDIARREDPEAVKRDFENTIAMFWKSLNTVIIGSKPGYGASVAWHEIGHALDAYYFKLSGTAEWKRIYAKFAGSKQLSQAFGEKMAAYIGFAGADDLLAESVALYVMDPVRLRKYLPEVFDTVREKVEDVIRLYGR